MLEGYLPQRLTAEEIRLRSKAIVVELGAWALVWAGHGVVKQRLAGQADMGLVSAAVKAALAG